jgi:DNA modification methylase
MSGTQPVLPRNQLLVGDARQRLRELPDASVDCVITSPPYFGLRDYAMDSQLGAERHIDEWVKGLLGHLPRARPGAQAQRGVVAQPR